MGSPSEAGHLQACRPLMMLLGLQEGSGGWCDGKRPQHSVELCPKQANGSMHSTGGKSGRQQHEQHMLECLQAQRKRAHSCNDGNGCNWRQSKASALTAAARRRHA
jgi:hypothetical protein